MFYWQYFLILGFFYQSFLLYRNHLLFGSDFDNWLIKLNQILQSLPILKINIKCEFENHLTNLSDTSLYSPYTMFTPEPMQIWPVSQKFWYTCTYTSYISKYRKYLDICYYKKWLLQDYQLAFNWAQKRVNFYKPENNI